MKPQDDLDQAGWLDKNMDEEFDDDDDALYCPMCDSDDLNYKYDIPSEETGEIVATRFECEDCGHQFDHQRIG